MSSRLTRSCLWYAGLLLWLPLLGYAISSANLILATVALTLMLLSLFFSLRRQACPGCGKVLRTISTPLRHCLYCGTAYPPETGQG
jgi:hypothetical protein